MQRAPRSRSVPAVMVQSPLSRHGQLGTYQPTEDLELPLIPEGPERQPEAEPVHNPFTALIPFLTSLVPAVDPKEKSDPKPSRYLVAKGLPTLPGKLVDKIWNLEYVDMEEFLPAPRSLRLAELGKPAPSLQESLVGAFNQMRAQQQTHKAQRQVRDIQTWTRCFTLYVAVMAKREGNTEIIPHMVAHLHTVMKLHQKAPGRLSWLEYDIQVRMEMAASKDRTWSNVDPWQYISCLPGPSSARDPFDLAEGVAVQQEEQELLQLAKPVSTAAQGESKARSPPAPEKGKRVRDDLSERAPMVGKPTAKRPKKVGTCRLFNLAPAGCPYGKECKFLHRCSNCGATDDHDRRACPFPPRPPRE